jgi:hypothetical protein
VRTVAIQALKPNVTREEAIRAFRSGGFSAAYWRIRSGPLQRVADAYVPFWVYRVRHEMVGTLNTRIFALDAVHGALDLYDQLLPRLPQDAAEELLKAKVLRVLFQQGFFKLRALKVEIERVPLELHLPYWLAFYGNNGTAKCRVMDAVRRRIEGAKASSFFEEWLAA